MRSTRLAYTMAFAVALLVTADANESETRSKPVIMAPEPIILAGACFAGSVIDEDPPISVTAIWDDTHDAVQGISPVCAFSGDPIMFRYCTSQVDIGRTFTIRAKDSAGNVTTLTVFVL